MCRLSQANRYQSIKDVLQHNVFSSRSMSIPIPGRVKVTNIPNDLCNTKVVSLPSGKPISMSNIFTIIHDWIFSVCNIERPLLIVYTIFVTLFYRTLPMNVVTNDLQKTASACLYLASSVVNPSITDYERLKDFTADAHSENDIKESVYKIVENCQGIIRSPSIYDETDNALEIVWWLLKSFDNCSMLEKSPKECHMMYAEVETNDTSLLLKRISKSSVVSIKYISKLNYKTIYKSSIDTISFEIIYKHSSTNTNEKVLVYIDPTSKKYIVRTVQ